MRNGKSTVPPCKAACPAGVDVPRYIRRIREGNFTEALAVIREKLPFPAVCGYACIHPCEAKCARVQYDEPVAIRLLKRAAQEYGGESEEVIKKAPPTGKKVAIIGAGPCGLTAAYYLSLAGHGVTVFEALPEPGGMLRYGIPEYRLPNDVLDREIERIAKYGVDIVINSRVTDPEELLGQGYNAVLVTVGAWNSIKLGVEGEELPHVMSGISFLKQVNSGGRPAVGKKVAVVGGGNTALDAARSAVRLGAKATIIYRRTRAQMPAGREEIADAVAEGVQFEYLAAPVKITENNITCIRMALGAANGDGRPRPVPVEGSEFDLECDTVIVAAGQFVDAGELNLETEENGVVKVDSKTLATGKKAVFAAGDAVTGPSSIIEAVAQGRQAGMSIDEFMGGAVLTVEPVAETIENIPEEAPRGTLKPVVQHMPVKERVGGFIPVEHGYDKEAAITEARRCLACDLREFKAEVNENICKGCGYCKEVCTLDVFTIADSFNQQGYRPAVAVNPEKCVGCLKCLYVCADFAINIENTCGA